MSAQANVLGIAIPESKRFPLQDEGRKLEQPLRQTATNAGVFTRTSRIGPMVSGNELMVIAFMSSDATPALASSGLSTGAVAKIDRIAAGEEDETRPAEFAYRNARSIVETAYWKSESHLLNVPGLIPSPTVTTDDVGGIRLAWRAGSKQIRANFGATPETRSYLYFESATEHNVEELDVEHLAGRLSWLMAR
jgi:hypothetical protein